MNANTDRANEKPNVTASVLKRLFQVFGSLLVLAAILFISSGHLGWVWAWVYIAVGVAILTINALVILPTDPELAAERSRIAEDTKGWDRVAVVLIFINGAGVFLVAGLDERLMEKPDKGRTLESSL